MPLSTFSKSRSQQAVRANSSGFGSRSARTSPFHTPRDGPDPGAYSRSTSHNTIGRKAAELRRSSSSSSFASRSSRFYRTGYESDPGGAPGPGSYEPNGTISTASRSFNKNSGGGFGRAARSSFFPKKENTPGPGSYDAARPQDKESARPNSAFASRTPGSSGATHVTAAKRSAPGVGDYEPSRETVASNASKSFSTAYQRGAGGFGTRAINRRNEASQKDPDWAPGPGSYAPEKTDQRNLTTSVAASRGKMSSSFSSNTLRGADWLFMGQTPQMPKSFTE